MGNLKRWVAGWALLILPCHLIYVLYVGLSLPIDYFIYHDYAALQMAQPRLWQDLFPASVQGYFNPTGFLLLQGMLAADLPSWWIALVLAALQSLNTLCVLLVAHALSRGRPAGHVYALGVGALGAAIAPMLLSVLGTSFLDPLTSVPLLAALWLLLRPEPRWREVLAAAFLAGAGTGLKLSNLPFALAIAVLVVLAGSGGLRGMAVRAASGAVAMWAGLLATHGWWGWQLWQRFGNPLFPNANGVFRSPWAPPETLVWPRFVPQDAIDVLTLPFRMAIPAPWIYMEATAPDLLPAAVVILALALVPVLAWRRARGTRPRRVAPGAAVAERRFWIYMAVAVAAWLATSGNGRYALPMLLLLGVAVALLALRLLDPRRATALCVILLLLQAGNTWLAGVVRWSAGQWTRHWIVMDVPEEFRKTPMLYVSADGSVKSALARHVHPGSSFVQLVGAFYSVPSDGVTGEWLQAAIARHDGRIRALFSAPREASGNVEGFAAYTRMLSRTLDRAGLAMDGNDCVTVAVNGQPAAGPNFNRRLKPPAREHLWACVARPVAPSLELAAARREADEVFAALEARCPGLYRPAGVQTEGDGRVWSRTYTMHDALVVTINQTDGTVEQQLFGQAPREQVAALGSWRDDIARYDCHLPFGGVRGSHTLKYVRFKTPGQ